MQPIIIDNEELTEGVYATGSGDGNCWIITYGVETDPNNNENLNSNSPLSPQVTEENPNLSFPPRNRFTGFLHVQ